MMEMALVENLQRDDLNPMEIALSYQRLMDECNLIIQEVADRVGKKRATVNNYLRLLKLPPDIQAAVRDNRLTMGHARALLGLTKTEDQLVLFKECLAKEYSVREIEKQVQRWIELDTAPPQAPEAQPLPDAYTIQLRAVEQQLESRFGTRVLIQADPQRRGEIRLKFFSGDDLNRLLELLNT
jgi:ParB family chromosome partitioning protein